MEGHTDAGDPAHLVDMVLSTTPQQSFESADRMLVEAAVIQECAEEMNGHVQTLYNRASMLKKEAFDLQKYGMEERQKATDIFDRIVKDYAWILARYSTRYPDNMPKIALAVEEGRALPEDVEAFGEKLREYVNNIGKNTNSAYVVTKAMDEEGEDASAITSTDQCAEATSSDIERFATDPDAFPAQTNDSASVAVQISDDEHQPSSSVADSVDSLLSDITSHKRKFQRPPKANLSLDDEEIPVTKKGKRQRRQDGRKDRNRRVLLPMGSNDQEKSRSHPDAVDALPRRKKASMKHGGNTGRNKTPLERKVNARASKDGME